MCVVDCGEGTHKCAFAIPNPGVYDEERAARIYERLRRINPIYETRAESLDLRECVEERLCRQCIRCKVGGGILLEAPRE